MSAVAPRPQLDSEYIFGVHEPGGEDYMLAAGRPGWIVFTEAVGHDVEDYSGLDFSTFAAEGLGVICRINHGYEPEGTLPHSSQYEQFARRVANFVETSRGCHTWVIGNEMNYAVERPGIVIDWTRHKSQRDGPFESADPMRRGLAVRFNVLPDNSTEIRTTRGAIVSPGEVITPEMYARCYRQCRDAIRRLPGHERDLVLVGAVAPWNTQTIYPGNPNGDWILYFRHICEQLGADQCDGFALHAYTRGGDPSLVSSQTRLPPPFQGYHSEFRVFSDFMAAVPQAMRHLPGFITEMDQTLPWMDRNEGWVRAAYAEVDAWNKAQEQSGNPQRIRCAALYRWPRLDKWFIDGKFGVIEDFMDALANDYRWHRTYIPEPTQVITPPVAPPEESAATAPADRRRSRRKRKEPQETPAYRIEWVDDRFPAQMTVSQVIEVPITLRNTGSITWRWQGGNPFRIGYRYFRGRKALEIDPERDIRTDLSSEVPPGEQITIPVRVALPTDPGNYTLEIDMVHEGVTWFRDQKSPALTRWVTVEAARSAASTNGVRLPAPDDRKLDLPVPLFTDVTTRLPRSASPYARRSLSQIKYIVISSTGANPRLPLDRIARAHIAAGYPGIAYGFVVDASGQVFRTSELESMAQPDQIWSEQGVNIALAGNYTAAVPSLPQLDATGRLCAWLAQNLGLAADSIVGLGELTRSDNPGPPFYHGAKWKEMITRQVQLHMAALGVGSSDQERAQEAIDTAAKLAKESHSLKLQLDDAVRVQEHLQGENAELRAQVMELTQQVSLLGEGGIRQPRMVNAVNDLPRDAQRYRKRTPEQVDHIVINHTGAPPNTPLALLVQEHRQEWPGLLYDFVIDGQGNITQTQPLDQVVAADEAYLSHAINIAIAGNFEESMPTRAQINAAAALIAWLIDRFPQLTVEQIKGLGELTVSNSPGRQWKTGKVWRNDLIKAVQRASGKVENSEAELALRARVLETEKRLEEQVKILAVQQEERAKLEASIVRLQAELAQARQGEGYIIPKPNMNVLVEQLPRHPTLRYEKRALNQITHLAIHHTAAPPTLGPLRIAELHVQADTGRGKESWPGIGYHFYIHADGSIDQTNLLETVCFHVYRHNQYSVGIVFAGSFMNGKIPTTAQLRAGAHLTAWLMQELKIPLARVWGHREYPENITVCPGSEWTQGNRWRDMLFERIEQVQSGQGVKSVRHYMLFPQPVLEGVAAAGNGAAKTQGSLGDALAYIAQFRPTVGFAPEDARNAEFVTIVGSESGIDSQIEQSLQEYGCRVERIDGGSDDETARILTEMAREGRRFRQFEVDF